MPNPVMMKGTVVFRGTRTGPISRGSCARKRRFENVGGRPARNVSREKLASRMTTRASAWATTTR
jgi:hypothetical protein